MRRAALLLGMAASAMAQPREIFKQLIEIDTTESAGSVTRASQAMAARLLAAGYTAADVQVVGGDARKRNLVVRLRGSGGARPVLFNSHLDVVEARREDWSYDPFVFLERDGYFHGRGTQDDKHAAAALVAAFVRLRGEGYRPKRDLILALTADEEGGSANGVQWLLGNRRELIDCEFSINADSGGGESRKGVPRFLGIQTSEKLYHTFFLETVNKGGHSSQPERDNAIYRLAAALGRIGRHEFPARLTETIRVYFEKMAALEPPGPAADMRAILRDIGDRAALARLSETPLYNAFLRTTCVATEVAGGHAENALPQRARASVNCRLLPGDDPLETERAVRRAVDDPDVKVTPARAAPLSPASPIRRDVFGAIERVSNAMWPGLPVIPVMETGGTDGRLLRAAGIPTYGETGMFLDHDDVRAHGRDERIPVKSFDEGAEFLYRLLKEFGQ